MGRLKSNFQDVDFESSNCTENVPECTCTLKKHFGKMSKVYSLVTTRENFPSKLSLFGIPNYWTKQLNTEIVKGVPSAGLFGNITYLVLYQCHNKTKCGPIINRKP